MARFMEFMDEFTKKNLVPAHYIHTMCMIYIYCILYVSHLHHHYIYINTILYYIILYYIYTTIIYTTIITPFSETSRDFRGSHSGHWQDLPD